MTFLLGGEIWRVGVVNLAVLACSLRATTKKRLSTFWRKQVHPQDKVLATLQVNNVLGYYISIQHAQMVEMNYQLIISSVYCLEYKTMY